MDDDSQPPRLPDPPPPGGPMHYEPARAATNGTAVASLVLGISAAILGILLFPLAVVFGFVGKGNAARGGGRGMAIAGIILGMVGIVLGVLWIVFIVAVADHDGIRISPSPIA